VAGVALTALGWLWWRSWVWRAPRLFAWQAWHLATWTFTLRGRRGAYGTGLALVAELGLAGGAAVCVAGVALGDIDLHFGWQAWHLRRWAGSGGAVGSGRRRGCLRGRLGIW